jgi:hypothetical protein
MFNINAVALAKLADALLRGDDNILTQMLEKKLESLGEDVISQLVSGPLGTANRIAEAVKTGGASEFERQRREWLGSITPAPLPGTSLINRLTNAFEKNAHLLTKPSGKFVRWDRTRKQWLDESYRHDWRTQRRDRHGRWIEGRTRYPYVPKRTRRERSMRRRAVRRMTRQIMKEMNRGS